MSLKVIIAPTAEPLTLNEARLHLRLIAAPTDMTPLPEDAYVTALITAARQGAEHITGRALMLQTLELALDEFRDADEPCRRLQGPHSYRVTLPRPPLVSITSVTYIDQDGASQTLPVYDVLNPVAHAYQLDSYSQPARIVPAYGTCWPAIRCQPNAVVVRYQAGYANSAAVPQEIKNWMLLRIGALYENRESVAVDMRVVMVEMPFVDSLLDPYRVWSL
jgi:uncharacterized phiE125 gp8 family phage protein